MKFPDYLTATEIIFREYEMATTTEIRQKLIQGGMSVEEASNAAKILSDMPPLTAPAGGIWDTLTAKGFRIVSRPINTQFRILSNEKKSIIVMTKDGMNSLFCEMAIESL